MKTLAFGIAAVAFAMAGAASAQPSTAYATQFARDAGACAQACAADGICMAWEFRAGDADSCALSAVVPEQTSAGAASGLSPRAPAFARARPPAHTPAPPAATTEPAVHKLADTLLGGPDETAQLSLRSRIDEPR